MKTLSVEQAVALLAFAARSGRSWKAELRTVWATCGYDAAGVGHEEAACLQQIRNAFGPLWLARVTMKQLQNITRWARQAEEGARYDREAEARAAQRRGIKLPADVTIRGDASTEPGAGGFEIAPPIANRIANDKTDTKLFEKVTSDEVEYADELNRDPFGDAEDADGQEEPEGRY